MARSQSSAPAYNPLGEPSCHAWHLASFSAMLSRGMPLKLCDSLLSRCNGCFRNWLTSSDCGTAGACWCCQTLTCRWQLTIEKDVLKKWNGLIALGLCVVYAARFPVCDTWMLISRYTWIHFYQRFWLSASVQACLFSIQPHSVVSAWAVEDECALISGCLQNTLGAVAFNILLDVVSPFDHR